MIANTLNRATASICRRLIPEAEPMRSDGRLAAAGMLLTMILAALVRAIVEAILAIFGVVTAPLAWAADRLGMRERPLTATEFAEAVVDAPPPPPPARAVVRPVTPLADLICAHIRYREWWDRGMREPQPLPPDVKAWLDSMTPEQRKRAYGTERVRLEQHVAAGRAGSTAWGPGDLRPLRPLPLPPIPSYAGANGKGGGGKGSNRVEPGTVDAELTAILAEHEIHLDYGYAAPGGRR